MRIFVFVSLFVAGCLSAVAQQPLRHVMTKDTISDRAIVLPESLETDVDSLFSSWYLKKYAIIDENCSSGENIDFPDSVYIKRLSSLPTLIEMPYNQIVKSYISLYTERRRKLVESMMGLGTYYFPIFEQALEKENLPLELKYLPIIESALRPEATSRAGAAGLWQFMIGTAKVLGMEVNSLVDERRDPVKSSEMAARYLKELFQIYNDWGLAIAAYNCGPGNVNKAIRRSGGKDYWEIYNFLPKETRGYLPAFIAANYVMHYYNEHNICPVYADLPLTTDTIHIDEQIHFQQIADVLNISIDQLRSLNPQYRRDIIPGTSKTRPLLLPTPQVYAFIERRDSIVRHQNELYAKRTTVEPSGYSSNTGGGLVYHKVRKGETLSKIAQRYGVSMQDIRQWNRMSNNSLVAGRTLKIYRPGTVAPAPAPVQKSTPASQPEVAATSPDTTLLQPDNTSPVKMVTKKMTETVYHKVVSGETLSKIAGRYGVSLANLKKWNGLNSDNIKIGQRLKIQKTVYRQVPADTPDDAALAETSASRNPEEPATVHTVISGETLSAIAVQYGITVAQLRAWNNLSGDGKIYAGQQLNVSPAQPAAASQESARYKYHTVAKGETLWSISQRFPGVTTDVIIKANDLKGTSLKVGQVLKIPVG
ncbi:MAG: LysM peptidoglycan-binding domain-containing protein [Coprobacter sp.]|nr:LysM peptidoglycan-binding domain-containing protein [Coprobacter sp.]